MLLLRFQLICLTFFHSTVVDVSPLFRKYFACCVECAHHIKVTLVPNMEKSFWAPHSAMSTPYLIYQFFKVKLSSFNFFSTPDNLYIF